jgi:hypothetical protein
MERTLLPLIDDPKCFEMVPKLRWLDGVAGPHCDSVQVAKRGMIDNKDVGDVPTGERNLVRKITRCVVAYLRCTPSKD